jgi:hypothetical protein
MWSGMLSKVPVRIAEVNCFQSSLLAESFSSTPRGKQRLSTLESPAGGLRKQNVTHAKLSIFSAIYQDACSPVRRKCSSDVFRYRILYGPLIHFDAEKKYHVVTTCNRSGKQSC